MASLLRRLARRPREAPFNTDRQHFETWQERAVDATSLWLDNRAGWRPDHRLRIADFGAGNERLRDVLVGELEEPFDYFAYDLHPQKRTTVKLNVLEQAPQETFDLVFALGLLEYLPPGNGFAERLRGCCRFAVVSYVFVGSSFPGGLPEREALGWKAHDDRTEFEHRFAGSGFSPVGFRTTNDGQTGLWLWESSAAS